MTHHPLVGFLVLILATCSGWCTRLHDHDAGLGHAATATDASHHEAEAPRPVNDDNCACAGALPQWEAAATPWLLSVSPLPLDHPFALAILPSEPTPGAGLLADGGTIPDRHGSPTAALRAQRLRC